MTVPVVGGLQAVIGGGGNNMGKIYFRIMLIVILTEIGGLLGCTATSSATPSPRQFSTSDLLIQQSQVPEDWRPVSEYRNEPFNALGYRDTLGGSSIEFEGPAISADHIVAMFSTTKEAANAYKDHDYTRDRDGIISETWHEIPGWTYISPLADQYRVVCSKFENIPKSGDLCVIEAQYEEFLSNVIYSNKYPDRTIDDLLLLAKSVDERMTEFLER